MTGYNDPTEPTATCSDNEVCAYYGRITEVDGRLGSFKLSPVPGDDETRIEISIRDLEDASPELDTSEMMDVHLMVSGKFDVGKDGTGKAQSIESPQVLDPLDVNYRLMELSSLRDGWGEHGDEIAPKAELLHRLMDLYDEFCGDMRLPHIYPTADGNIQMEWDSDDLMEMEVDLGSMKGTLYLGDGDADIDLNSEEGWDRLSELVSGDDGATFRAFGTSDGRSRPYGPGESRRPGPLRGPAVSASKRFISVLGLGGFSGQVA